MVLALEKCAASPRCQRGNFPRGKIPAWLGHQVNLKETTSQDQTLNMPVQALRIVDSDPEASLDPRAIWKHWKEWVLWDHRTYYGTRLPIALLPCLTSSVRYIASLEFIAVLVLILGLIQYPPFYQDNGEPSHILRS